MRLLMRMSIICWGNNLKIENLVIKDCLIIEINYKTSKNMIKTSIDREKSKFLNSFVPLIENEYLDESEKTKLDLFMLNLNACEFNTSAFKENMEEHIIEFSLSRHTKEKLKNCPVKLSREARQKLKDGMNTGN